jgi:hypothetical protein
VGTRKQHQAQKRNFNIFRLRGALATIDNIRGDGTLCYHSNERLFTAWARLKDAIDEEVAHEQRRKAKNEGK